MKKTALVTGATSGIGLATAIKLSQLGYQLIITGRRKKRLEEVKTKIETRQCEVTTMSS